MRTAPARAVSPRLVYYSLAWIAVFAAADILIIEGVFRKASDGGYGPIWSTAGTYYLAMFFLLFPITTLGAFRWKAWAPILFAVAGWEDILYFWLQARPVPTYLPWLLLHPTDVLLYLHATAALAFVLVVTVELPILQRRQRNVARALPPG